MGKQQIQHQVVETALKSGGDVTAISIWVAALMDTVPAIAAVMSLIWTLIRIYETKTVQKLISKNDKE
jgi:hypothetical protein